MAVYRQSARRFSVSLSQPLAVLSLLVYLFVCSSYNFMVHVDPLEFTKGQLLTTIRLELVGWGVARTFPSQSARGRIKHSSVFQGLARFGTKSLQTNLPLGEGYPNTTDCHNEWNNVQLIIHTYRQTSQHHRWHLRRMFPMTSVRCWLISQSSVF